MGFAQTNKHLRKAHFIVQLNNSTHKTHTSRHPTNHIMNEKSKPTYTNGLLSKTETPLPLWKWKRIQLQDEKLPQGKLTEFFESKSKPNDIVLGPGVGAGVGCGVGLGLGVVGGAVLGGSDWNQLSAVFGVGIGCGVGVGFGYGQGFGAGFSFESFKSRVLKLKSNEGT